jgi:hypothetical protein
MDCLHDGFGLAHHIVIPESHHAITFRIQPARTVFVTATIDIVSMLRSIDLDDEAFFQTGEVRNIGSDRDLSSKVTSLYLKLSKMAPKNIFRGSSIGS